MAATLPATSSLEEFMGAVAKVMMRGIKFDEWPALQGYIFRAASDSAHQTQKRAYANIVYGAMKNVVTRSPDRWRKPIAELCVGSNSDEDNDKIHLLVLSFLDEVGKELQAKAAEGGEILAGWLKVVEDCKRMETPKYVLGSPSPHSSAAFTLTPGKLPLLKLTHEGLNALNNKPLKSTVVKLPAVGRQRASKASGEVAKKVPKEVFMVDKVLEDYVTRCKTGYESTQLHVKLHAKLRNVAKNTLLELGAKEPLIDGQLEGLIVLAESQGAIPIRSSYKPKRSDLEALGDMLNGDTLKKFGRKLASNPEIKQHLRQ